MLPYWLLFAAWALGAVETERRRAVQDPRLLLFIIAAVATILLIGLRFEVGGDWNSYLLMYQNIYFLPFGSALSQTDAGYAAVNWIATRGDWGMTLVNLVCGALFMGGFARLAWRQPNPALAVVVAVPYLIIVVAMGYTRQAAAIGIICLAVADASERHLIRLVVLLSVAALFHKTALLMLPVALVPVLRRNLLIGTAGVIFFFALFALLLRGSSNQLVADYVQSDYDSQGAYIRVAMNVVAASVFLMLRKRINLPPFQKSFWTTCSVLSFVSVAGLVLASASSGVDRLSLYLVPLQAVIYPRLPYMLGSNGRASPAVVIGLLGYSFLVEFVWLNYAANAGNWVPYHSVFGAA